MRLKTIDYHCGGSPMRIITGGLPTIEGSCFEERKQYVHKNLDFIRKQLCWEPRGYRSMTVVMPVAHDQSVADVGVIFCAATMYLPMCGEATICFTRYLLEHGLIKGTEPETKLVVQCPPGLVTCYAEWTNGKVGNIRLNMVPSFVHAKDRSLKLSTGLEINANLVYGGAYYVVVYQDELKIDIDKNEISAMTSLGDDVTERAIEAWKEVPVSGTIIADRNHTSFSFHFIVVGESMVNRGFCGSGSTCRAAFDYFSGKLKLGETRDYGSIVTKQCASVSAVKATKVGKKDAVIIEIKNKAYRTGCHEFEFEEEDPLRKGFLV